MTSLYKARRWAVERAHSWMNRFRRLLVRWEKKACNYLAFLHLACAFITIMEISRAVVVSLVFIVLFEPTIKPLKLGPRSHASIA